MKLKRNRIVIDLDNARADQQGRVRSGRAGRVEGADENAGSLTREKQEHILLMLRESR